MNKLEDIQEIIKMFVEESKQAKQEIAQIESERTKLAQERNEKKEANINDYVAEINMLGKQISILGNQSQEIQNKLDKKYNDVKKVVNLMVDNLITEGIRKIRKINEEREELEEKISIQEERNAKYEIQKQEFYERFGRIPELSENAKREDEVQDKQCQFYKNRIIEVEEKIENEEIKLAQLAQIAKNFKDKNWTNIIGEEKIEEEQEETTVLPLIEEIEVAEMEPIAEISVEELEPIQEIKVQDFEPIEEIHIEEFEQPEEIEVTQLKVEPFKEEENQPIVNTIEENKQIDEIEELAKAIVEQIVEEQTRDLNINKIEDNSKDTEQEIIAFEEKEAENILPEEIELVSIIAKIEDGEIVYKAQINNGEEIKVYPRKLASGNALLNDKERRENIKVTLIDYAISEYKPLDRRVVKKLDPIVCEVLNKFAATYNYDARNLMYNYAMSFSRSEVSDGDTVPITYNFSYINGTKLRKTEKRTMAKICKNASRNEKIDIIGDFTKYSGIKYIFKKLFVANNVKSLTEGKY